jgi:hypothetical protein
MIDIMVVGVTHLAPRRHHPDNYVSRGEMCGVLKTERDSAWNAHTKKIKDEHISLHLLTLHIHYYP